MFATFAPDGWFNFVFQYLRQVRYHEYLLLPTKKLQLGVYFGVQRSHLLATFKTIKSFVNLCMVYITIPVLFKYLKEYLTLMVHIIPKKHFTTSNRAIRRTNDPTKTINIYKKNNGPIKLAHHCFYSLTTCQLTQQ